MATTKYICGICEHIKHKLEKDLPDDEPERILLECPSCGARKPHYRADVADSAGGDG